MGKTVTTRRLIVAGCVLALTILPLGCSQTAAPPQQPTASAPSGSAEGTAAATQPSAGTTASADEATGPISPAEVLAIVQAKCTICHTIDRVNKAKKDWKGWAAAIDHMSRNGASLTPRERQAVVDYLSSRK